MYTRKSVLNHVEGIDIVRIIMQVSADASGNFDAKECGEKE